MDLALWLERTGSSHGNLTRAAQPRWPVAKPPGIWIRYSVALIQNKESFYPAMFSLFVILMRFLPVFANGAAVGRAAAAT